MNDKDTAVEDSNDSKVPVEVTVTIPVPPEVREKIASQTGPQESVDDALMDSFSWSWECTVDVQ